MGIWRSVPIASGFEAMNIHEPMPSLSSQIALVLIDNYTLMKCGYNVYHWCMLMISVYHCIWYVDHKCISYGLFQANPMTLDYIYIYIYIWSKSSSLQLVIDSFESRDRHKNSKHLADGKRLRAKIAEIPQYHPFSSSISHSTILGLIFFLVLLPIFS